jgi:Arc/MetJ-type ribon-helix-helix transcriptional regulator
MPFTYRIKEFHRRKIEEYVKHGEFDSIASFITEAISNQLHHLEERDFRLFILSEEGKMRIHQIAEDEVERLKKNIGMNK